MSSLKGICLGASEMAYLIWPSIFFLKNNRALGLFVFPLHLVWLSLPFILLPTAIIVMIPGNMALENIPVYLSQMIGAIVSAIASLKFFEIFALVQTMVLDFFDFMNLSTLRIIGLISIGAFVTFIGISMRTTIEKFKPRDLYALLFFSVYWLILLGIFIHAFALEILRKERRW